jgi:hypothetical protein
MASNTPCFQSPASTYLSEPHPRIVQTQETFAIPNASLSGRGGNASYAFFCREASPPDYLGWLGDIYVDVTPSNPKLYGKTLDPSSSGGETKSSGKTVWKKWLGSHASVNVKHHLHPEQRVFRASKKTGWMKEADGKKKKVLGLSDSLSCQQ